MNIQESTDGLLSIGVSEGCLMDVFSKDEAVVMPIDRMCLMIVAEGDVCVDIDGVPYDVHKRSALYLLPNRLLKLRSFSLRVKVLYVSLAYDLLSDFPLLLKADVSDYIGNHPCCDLSEHDFCTLAMYHDLLLDRSRADEIGVEIIKGLLFSFVSEVNRLYSGKTPDVQVTRQDKIVDGFFRLLHRHFIEERYAAFYADALCVSDKHLMRVVKQKTGRSFHSWLTDFLIRQAKLLLLSTDMTVTQVSDSLRFPNSSAFAKYFRKCEGLSPLEYRKKCQHDDAENSCG